MNELIIGIEVTRLRDLLAQLVQDGRLCTTVGHILVAEFNCRGGFDEVVEHINNYINDLEQITYVTVDQRIAIIERIERGEAEYDRLISDSLPMLKNALETANITEDLDDLSQHYLRVHDLEEELHNKRECLCYTNKE